MLESALDWIVEITNAQPLYFPSVGFAQLLDIFIVAVLLYTIIRWIKRTQAWMLLRGIALILLLALAAEVFELIAVQWIVDNAIGMGLVVVVILFQPELRKALEQIGRSSDIIQLKTETGQPTHNSEHTVDEVMKAAELLSGTLTGALIVLEQDIDLNEYERTGVPLDAQVSAQLLLNIFEKNTPLHDGAVIVKDNRVSAATCILPITSQSLDSSYGTRHRAAVGVTEVSDARVLIVSEETGAISVVLGGRILHDVSGQKMRELLLWGVKNKSMLKLFGHKRPKK